MNATEVAETLHGSGSAFASEITPTARKPRRYGVAEALSLPWFYGRHGKPRRYGVAEALRFRAFRTRAECRAAST